MDPFVSAVKNLTTGHEFQRDGVDAVTDVFVSQVFALKNVTEMTAAFSTGYFRPLTIAIEGSLHSASDFVVEARPATVGVKLIARPIERGVALPADKQTRPIFLEQGAAIGHFGAFI